MTIQDYENIYDSIVDLSFDAEGLGEDDIEKANLIIKMIECLEDVPLREANSVLGK